MGSINRVERISQPGRPLAVVSANGLPISLILSILIMEAIRPSETSIITRATRRHIPDDSIVGVKGLPGRQGSLFAELAADGDEIKRRSRG
jgi:hypothetical protein